MHFKVLNLSLFLLMCLAPIISLMFLTTTVNLLILLLSHRPHCYSSSPLNLRPGCFLSQECSEIHLVNFVTSFNLFSNVTFFFKVSMSPFQEEYLLKVLFKISACLHMCLYPGTLHLLIPINFLYCLALIIF